MSNLPIETFLADLAHQDIKLWLDGEKLRCSGPEDLLTDSFNAGLKARKSEIIAFLRQVQGQSAAAAVLPADRTKPLPLSFAQQRLWFLHQMQPNAAVYNLPMAIEVEGFLDVAAFTQSLNGIVRRHEALRTRFVMVDGQPAQVIEAPAPVSIEQIDFQDIADPTAKITQAAITAAQAPFDLSRDQLLRVTLLRLGEVKSVVLFTLHHIIADGWSMEILIQELGVGYRAALMGQMVALPDLSVQYADFSVWQHQWLQGENLENQLNYWRNQLDVNQSVLQLPTDFPRAR
ncbi:MAG: condensation domain-containing protein, partial [Cyanobacteria bacterium P01_D01_bin.2]